MTKTQKNQRRSEEEQLKAKKGVPRAIWRSSTKARRGGVALPVCTDQGHNSLNL